jgi:phenylpyruvate tautomerase PptA (4-oxalocrotonate tautomerase family)
MSPLSLHTISSAKTVKRQLSFENLIARLALAAPKEITMPFARIDLAQGKPPEFRATLADIVYKGIVGVLKAPDGDRFIVVGEHAPENLIYDPQFLGMKRSPDFLLIQVTSTVGNDKGSKLAFFRYIADQLKSKLGVRPDDVMINLVFVQREDWSFGNGEPWN